MRMKTNRRILTGLLIGALALLAPAAARSETDQVRIGLQYGLIYLPLVIADVEKFYQKRAQEQGLGGLKVTLQRFSGSANMNEALLSNSIDLGAYGLPGLLIAWEKTKGRMSIKGLAGLALTAYVLDTNKPGINSLKDFGEDDKIAVTALNSPQSIFLRMAAEQAFGPGQYKKAETWMVSLPHPDSVTALLSNAGISGYFSTPPFTQILAKDSHIHPVVRSRDILGGMEATGAALSGGQRFVDANPKVVHAVLAALDDAMQLAAHDPRRAAQIYLDSEGGKMTLDEVQPLITDGSTTYQTAPQGVKLSADFMVKIGMLAKAPASWKEVFFPFVETGN